MENMSRQELDDAAAGARDIARVTKAQYDAFIECGFSVSQSLQLTGIWMATLLGQTGGE